MIVKNREMPLTIQKLEALLRRLPQNHPKIPLIKENLAKSMAGYLGECSLDYPLSYLPEKNFFIFHDVRLKGSKNYFQIDILMLSKQLLLSWK